MASYLSPGIYTREIDFSFYVKQISTSSCAMIGVAEKGPINKAALVTSWEQFVRKFGSYLQSGYLAYAARLFFRSPENFSKRNWKCRIPPLMLSEGSNGRETPHRSAVWGISCINPIAPLRDTAQGSKFDSTLIMALTRSGLIR